MCPANPKTHHGLTTPALQQTKAKGRFHKQRRVTDATSPAPTQFCYKKFHHVIKCLIRKVNNWKILFKLSGKTYVKRQSTTTDGRRLLKQKIKKISPIHQDNIFYLHNLHFFFANFIYFTFFVTVLQFFIKFSTALFNFPLFFTKQYFHLRKFRDSSLTVQLSLLLQK